MTVAPDPQLLDARLRGLVSVDRPLMLITQAQRSGGTLLLRLLDGHPACDVAPFQLRSVDAVAKRLPTEPGEAWQALYDPKLVQRYERGHRQRKGDVLRDEEVFSFDLPPDLQRAIYDHCASRGASPTTRDLFDSYFTSYFNAWLDYRNLGTPKRWVVGFEPGIAQRHGRRRAVREVYPDGRIVSIVRDPWSWFASARRWEARWEDRTRAVDYWLRAGRGTLKWRRVAKRDLCIVRFEDLLTNTAETLRRLAAWLSIEFIPEPLLTPTFNGRPIRANTSFDDVGTEVSTRPLERASRDLDADDAAFIEERAGRIYRRLLKKAAKDWEAMGRLADAGS